MTSGQIDTEAIRELIRAVNEYREEIYENRRFSTLR